MKAREFTRKIIDIITTPEMRVLPGQLAFFIVMSFIPLIALSRIIATQLGLPLSSMIFSSIVPKDVALIISNIESHSSGATINLIVFLVLSFVLASNGAHSMIITSNEIYKLDSSDWLSRRVKAIFMTLVFVGLFVFMLLVPVFGDTIFNLIKENVKNPQDIDILFRIYQIIKYPIMIIIIYFSVKWIYITAPDIKIKSKSTTSGALFTTIGWLISSEIYSLYTTYFVRYDLFLGSISSLLILLIWMYIMAYIFSIGLIINASGSVSQIEKEESK